MTLSPHNTVRRFLTGAAALALAAGLAGCASAGGSDATTPAVAASSSTMASAVTLQDAWVKAVPDGMTAAFGVLKNDSDAAVTLTSAATPASDMVQLHETVDDGTGQMVMREKKDGFTIPAHGSFTLEPGGNHIMFMGVAKPIVAGDEVKITLTFSDGSTTEITAAAKDYTGANETYTGDEHSPSPSH